MHFCDKCVANLATFPGSPHVQAMESWAGPGSEAIANLATFKTFCTTLKKYWGTQQNFTAAVKGNVCNDL